MTADAVTLARSSFEAAAERNIFVMMRYREDRHFRELEATIRRTVTLYGLSARFAKDVAYREQLWDNIVFYMKHSSLGIAVFEEINEREFNPNVSIELGYMLALERRCLILKDRRMPRLPTDVCGRIYSDFDTYDIQGTVPLCISKWCENSLGLRLIDSETAADLERCETERNLRLNPFVGWVCTVWQLDFPTVVAALEQAESLQDLARRIEASSLFPEGGELSGQIRNAQSRGTSTVNDARALLGKSPLME